MKLLFLTIRFDEQSYKTANADCRKGVQTATQKFQSSLINGIKQNASVKLTELNVLPVGTFPVCYKRLFIRKLKTENGGMRIPFINFTKIKKLIIRRNLYKAVYAYLKREGEDCIILAYSMYMPFLRVLSKIKRRFTSVKIVYIQTDLLLGNNDGVENAKTKRLERKMLNLSACADGFVILTEYMRSLVEARDRRCLVLEGVADTLSPLAEKRERSGVPVFFYGGTLNAAFNIKELVDAFLLLEGKAALKICGAGDSLAYVKAAARDSRAVEYLGYLDAQGVKAAQTAADYLINPRRPNGGYTKYSFPSKTFEYLSSGRPTVMYKLEGVPDEYDRYINYLTANSAQNLAAELNALIEADYALLLARAAEARAFITQQKSESAQADKLIKFLRELS